MAWSKKPIIIDTAPKTKPSKVTWFCFCPVCGSVVATFFTFSHNFDCYMTVNSFIRQRNKKKWRIQSFLASFFVFYQICNKNGHRFRLFSLFKSRRKEYAFSTHRKCFIPVLEALESLWCYNVVTIWNIRYRYFVIRRFLIIFATET